jgi:hypothetical protein
VGRSRYKCPRSVVLERVVLLLHCGHPLWVAHGGAHRRWWGCRLGRRCQVRILGIGHPDPMLRTCDHVVSWRLSSGRWWWRWSGRRGYRRCRGCRRWFCGRRLSRGRRWHKGGVARRRWQRDLSQMRVRCGAARRRCCSVWCRRWGWRGPGWIRTSSGGHDEHGESTGGGAAATYVNGKQVSSK